jgi:hypothetical protein
MFVHKWFVERSRWTVEKDMSKVLLLFGAICEPMRSFALIEVNQLKKSVLRRRNM